MKKNAKAAKNGERNQDDSLVTAEEVETMKGTASTRKGSHRKRRSFFDGSHRGIHNATKDEKHTPDLEGNLEAHN